MASITNRHFMTHSFFWWERGRETESLHCTARMHTAATGANIIF